MPIHPLGIVAAPQEFDGAKILQIEPGSVAEMASLHVGDLIRTVNGKAVRTPMELAAELADKTGKVRIGIVRGKYATETVIVLGTH
jgi:S1-C subfamily serine protease